MAEDDWAKKRKRSEDSSSDESSQSSSACESYQGSEGPAEKTSIEFEISTQSQSKSALLTPRTKELGFIAIDAASCSGLSKGKCHKDVAKGVKRRLWDVDAEQVELDLDREFKRMHKEETLDKSAKWNFDFERDAPLSGGWSWFSTESAPGFYKSKDITSKFKPVQPPTISKWPSDPPSIQISATPQEGNLIRPKAIRPSTSKPAAIEITFSSSKECTKSEKADAETPPTEAILETGPMPKLQSTSSGALHATSLTDTTSTPLSSADGESGTISSSSTTSHKASTESKSINPIVLRPRKKQKLERKKSLQIKRFR